MNYTKGESFYEGKAKRLFHVQNNQDVIYQEFKDSLTAFNGVKKSELSGKGALNRDISSLIFNYLKQNGVDSHWIADEGKTGMITKKVNIIPLEVVVRNRMAGSLAKKLGKEEGAEFARAIVDFHFKEDSLNDPFVSEDQIEVVLKAASRNEIQELREKALRVNTLLKDLFFKMGLHLIDFKLEFGKTPDGKILLADEISPDCCRLWDVKTGEKRDKDRFRRDLGDVLENYALVLKGLKTALNK